MASRRRHPIAHHHDGLAEVRGTRALAKLWRSWIGLPALDNPLASDLIEQNILNVRTVTLRFRCRMPLVLVGG